MRGRLIFPFVVEYARLDPDGTGLADPDDTEGPLTSGFDDDFRAPFVHTDATGARVSARVEQSLIAVPAQIEDKMLDRLRQIANGNAPMGVMALIHHFRDLERLALVDSDGRALIRMNDRLVRILTRSGTVVNTFPNPPGMYVRETTPRSYGLGTGNRNLLEVVLQDREQGSMTGG